VSLCYCYVSFSRNFGIWRHFLHLTNLNDRTNSTMPTKMFLIINANSVQLGMWN
jgi:hypothetical protein